ncbi:MAG: hypothetical protein GY820_18565 [Gammaproteobacteria bacterium]|nr:hypothetical protein [Gammaproteobacteria bacterium]
METAAIFLCDSLDFLRYGLTVFYFYMLRHPLNHGAFIIIILSIIFKLWLDAAALTVIQTYVLNVSDFEALPGIMSASCWNARWYVPSVLLGSKNQTHVTARPGVPLPSSLVPKAYLDFWNHGNI